MAPNISTTTTTTPTPTPSPSTIRLGTASPSTQATRAATLAQLSEIARRAAAERVDLLLLPEAYVGGYPRGADFGCAVGSRTRTGRDEFARYFASAADLGDVVGPAGNGGGERWIRRQLRGYHEDGDDGDGDDTTSPPPQRGDGTREELERIARETGVFLVVGVVERAGGTLYCAVVYVCPRAGTLGKRRKVMPTGAERLCWGQGGAGTLRAVTTTLRGGTVRVNLAAAVCWESYMPLLRQALYAQNVSVYLAPTADARDAWLALMRTVAIEGRCFVVSSNMCQRRPGAPAAAAAAVAAVAGDGDGDGDGERRRRSSMLTADGHVIALPPPRATAASDAPAPSVSSHATTAAHCRHRSHKSVVVDDDGNEIVLSCPDNDDRNSSSSGNSGGDPSLANNSAASPSPADTTTAAAAAADDDDDDDDSAACSGSSGWLSRGGSSIVSPFGRVLAGPQWEDDSGLICADVDLSDCVRGRLDLDTAGSYSRNDSFKLTVAGLDLDPLPYF